MTLSRRLAAEALGTALLLAMVVGSAIMAERLAGGNEALAQFANSLASAAGLLALILAFGAISGGHFNPAVTIAEALRGNLKWQEAGPYIAGQMAGAFAGVAAAHLMFGEPAFAAATQARTGVPLWWSEALATSGLIGVMFGCARNRPALTPFAVAAYLFAAYWFTSSSAFANPALTLSRAATDSAAGIRLADVPAFIVCQLLGSLAATAAFGWMFGQDARRSKVRRAFAPAASPPPN